MKEVFEIILVIIGALIGAGFASGQEIFSFFYRYGNKGFLGLIVNSVLISVLIYKIFNIVIINKINNYDEFLSLFIKNRKSTKIINLIINILLLITFYIMIAGFGAYFEQEIGGNNIIGSLILAILCFMVFLTSVKGVLKVSKYIVPFLIVFIIIIGAISISSIKLENMQIVEIKKGWFFSAVTYCSYNIILLIPVLITLRNQIKQKKSIKYIAIISGGIFATLSIIIYILLLKSDVEILTLEMPIVYIIRKMYPQFKDIYAFIILASIFTTAISIGVGLLQNITQNRKSYTQFVLFMCISSLIISNFGFSKLVNFVYPFFGYIGIIQIMLILLKNVCKK